MNEGDSRFSAGSSKITRTVTIYRKGKFLLCFGLVNCCIGRGIDDKGYIGVIYRLFHCYRIGNIKFGNI